MPSYESESKIEDYDDKLFHFQPAVSKSLFFFLWNFCGKCLHYFFFLVLGSHLAMLRGRSWLCTQELPWWCTGSHVGCRGLNLGWLRVSKCPLRCAICCSGPIYINVLSELSRFQCKKKEPLIIGIVEYGFLEKNMFY